MIPRPFRALPAILLPLLWPALCGAQATQPTVQDCDWRASAANIAEPWEANTRTFSNGGTRLAVLDTIEPALGWAHVLVLSPPYAELGDRQCKVIGIQSYGFAGIRFADLTAAYDPASGLTFTVPVQVYNAATAAPDWVTLTFTLNQATGTLTARLTP